MSLTEIEKKIKEDRRIINSALAGYLKFSFSAPPPLIKAIRYAVIAPGKRLRPILALESFFACGGKKKSWILPFCCGLELIHNFSLIQDDLPCMDDDDFRRGRQTLHRKFDAATAILTADALLASAYDLFAGSPAPAEQKIKVIRAVSRAIGIQGMASGQLLDISSTKSHHYFLIARLKTAELIAIALQIGAIIAGAPSHLEKKLYKLGLDFGVLFQFTDDLLDYKQELGKSKLLPYHQETLRQQVCKLATKTEKGFSTLGENFKFFVGIVKLIPNRRR